MLRCDRALQTLCGVRAFPSDDTVPNFFRRFGPAQIARYFAKEIGPRRISANVVAPGIIETDFKKAALA